MMPSLFAWGKILRSSGPRNHVLSLSSYARALSSRAAHQTPLDDAKREKQRLRYRDDPEYRQRRIDTNSRYNAKNKEEVNQRHRERYQSDPAFREHRLQQIKKWRASQGLEWHRRWGYPSGKKASERKLADDALHEQYRVYQRAYSKKRYSDPQQKFYAGLRDWFYRHKQKLDHCVWKHYTPIFHAEKVERTCATCAKTRINGGKLWFQRKHIISEPEAVLYDCPSCFAKLKWSRIVPMEAKGKSHFYKPGNPEVLAMLEAREKE